MIVRKSIGSVSTSSHQVHRYAVAVLSRILSHTWATLGAVFWPLSGWLAVIAVPYEIAVGALESAAPDTTNSKAVVQAIAVLGFLLLVSPIATVLTIRFAEAHDNGTPRSPRRAIGEGFERMPTFAGTIVLLGLMVAGAVIPFIILAGTIGSAGGLVGIAIAFAAVLYIVARFGLAIPALVIECLGPTAALRRSSEATAGSLRGMLGSLLVIGLIAAAFSLAGGLLGNVGSGAGAIGFRRLGDLIAFVLGTPVSTLGTLYLFLDRRAATKPAEPAPW